MKSKDIKTLSFSNLVLLRHPTLIQDQRAMLGIVLPQHLKFGLILKEEKCLKQYRSTKGIWPLLLTSTPHHLGATTGL